MKKLLCTAAVLGIAALVSAPAMATDVGVSVAISQPGVYGRIDIGSFPQPAVVAAQPVIIQQPRVVVAQPVQPVYMWVPPGHQKHWDKHCREYNACGVPVYFVKDEWYQQNVMHGKDGDRGEHGKGKGHGKGKHGD
jgi:hypothetical protein